MLIRRIDKAENLVSNLNNQERDSRDYSAKRIKLYKLKYMDINQYIKQRTHPDKICQLQKTKTKK